MLSSGVVTIIPSAVLTGDIQTYMLIDAASYLIRQATFLCCLSNSDISESYPV